MKIITRRDCVREVVGEFERHYAEHLENPKIFPDGETPGRKLERLRRLELDFVAPEVVDEIVGNESWTWPECDVCLRPYDEVVEMQTRGWRVRICRTCLNDALKLK